MRDKPIFIDTNILIYAHDLDAKEKHKLAKEKLTYLWNLKLPPSISIQVLQEFYVNLVKKEVPLKIARETVLSYLEWDVIQNDEGLLLEGIRIKERYNLSFWDALIIAAAKAAEVELIWSEDLNPGQEYEGIVVVNPLLLHRSDGF